MNRGGSFDPRALARFAPVLAGLLALALYLATMPHGLTWDLGGADGGELAAAVYTLGLAHPPGYPTYLLAAQAARLIPLPSFAWRLNVFSALCTAGAVILAGDAAARAIAGGERPGGPARLAGALAGLVFGLVEVVWTQAVVTEVYALAALFAAGLIWLTLHAEHAPDEATFTRRLAVFGLVGGLGLGAHYLVGLVLLFAVLYLLFQREPRLRRHGNLAAAPAFLLGLAAFAYLPLRAGAVPLSNWGDPETPARFWRVVTAADYAGRFQPALIARRLPALVGVLVRQLSVPGLALALVGLSVWWERRRGLLAAALVTAALNLLFVAGYASADTLPYLAPTLLLLALALATALYTVVWVWLPPAWRPAGGAGLALVVLVPLLARGTRIVGQATTTADAYGREVVAHAPAGALILSEDERQTFAIRYAALVSVRRPDVIPVDPRLLQFDWYRADLARFYPQLGLDASTMSPGAFLARLPAGVPVVRAPPLPD